MADITLDGVVFSPSDWLNRGHLTSITVDSVAYPRWQGMWVAGINEINTKVGQVGGLGVSMAYAAETGSTSDAAPGDGKLTWNNATQASATTIYLDAQDANGVDLLTLIDTLDDSTSTIKGHLRVTAVADNSKWIVYAVTAVTSATGYRKITVAAVDQSETSPFADGDALSLTFSRTGDKGDTGTLELTVGTLTGSIDADGYDITGIGTLSATTATVTTAAVTDLTVSGLTTIAQAGQNAEGNATNVTGEVTLAATGAPVLRHTLTGDVTYLVAGAPTPGKGWNVEVRPTQDGTGGRAVTILPVNQLTYSGDLQSTAEAGETRPWSDTNTSLSLNAAVGPDGQTTLTKLIEDATTNVFARHAIVTGLAPSQTLTLSVVVKGAGNSRNIRVLMYDSGATGNSVFAIINPDTGAVVTAATNAGNATGATVSVTALQNSCYRIDLTGQPNISGSNTRPQINLFNGTSSSYAGNGASGVYIGEIQVNKGTPVGIAKVGATRAGMVTWRNSEDEIDFAAQAASTASRILISYGSDGEILVDDVSLVS